MFHFSVWGFFYNHEWFLNIIISLSEGISLNLWQSCIWLWFSSLRSKGSGRGIWACNFVRKVRRGPNPGSWSWNIVRDAAIQNFGILFHFYRSFLWSHNCDECSFHSLCILKSYIFSQILHLKRRNVEPLERRGWHFRPGSFFSKNRYASSTSFLPKGRPRHFSRFAQGLF